MELYVADAFTQRRFSGNAAGVVPLGAADFPDDALMREIAAELKHSETAFVRQTGDRAFHLRYFTPVDEVELCGHATVAAFSVLRDQMGLPAGDYTVTTLAGVLGVSVEADTVWLDMAPGRICRELSSEEALPVYEALGLDLSDAPRELAPAIVNTGLSDILLPVKSLARLNGARLDREPFTALSRAFDVCGAHAFCLDDPAVTAHCRNFAPLYGIDEECATGTANGALTYYLLQKGLLAAGGEQQFVQGEAMGRRSVVRSRSNTSGAIRIGGSGVACFRCQLL